MAASKRAAGGSGRIVPPADLLEQVSGVEEALRRGRHLGVVGWFALALSLAQGGLALFARAASLDRAQWVQQLLVAGTVVCLGLAVALINWTRFWVRESRRPFRYTYSIADFVDLDAGKSRRQEMPLHWLRTDLDKRLSERIGRLSHLDDAGDPADPDTRSHIHITGSYGIRESGGGDRFYEVLSWIRVGGRDRPATLAHPVTFRIASYEKRMREEYDKLVERIYFSIATEIYQRLREDVQRKIDLLPLRSFRAAAYFHEAEDYVRSNTLEAFDDAQRLYLDVIRIYDPDWFALPESLPLRVEKLAARGWARATRWLAIAASNFWPRLARNQLMAARAYIGYATVLTYRRNLATLAGQRLNPMFEARPAIGRALQRLDWLPDQVRGTREARFDALVTRALIRNELDSPDRAMAALEEARRLEPIRSEKDARWLFARGVLENRPLQRLQFLRRSVEIDTRFELSQYRLAAETDQRWRMRERLDEITATMAFDEYRALHDLNPANVVAWANHAYMYWLLGDLDESERHYRRGLEYKKIRRATFVAQLDSGLARITAERGEFVRAYHHYIAATSSTLAVGVNHGLAEQQVNETLRMTHAMMERYDGYLARVRDLAARRGAGEKGRRLVNSVLSFVITDYGRACYQYFLDTADPTYLRRAKDAFTEARCEELGGRYVLPHYYSHQLAMREPAAAGAAPYDGEHIRRVHELDENWVDGALEYVLYSARSGPELRKWFEAKERSAKEHRRAAESHDRRAHRVPIRELDGGAAAGADGQRADAERADLPGRVADGLLRKADDERAAASDAEEQAARLERLLQEFDRTSQELVRRLLPHRWLWRGEEFNWEALRSPRFRHERRWEREFDDEHVDALYAMSTGSGSGDRRLQVIEHIRRHFRAADRAMLVDAIPLTGDAARSETFKRPLRCVTEAWIQFDTAYWSLSWLLPDDAPAWGYSADRAADLLLLGRHRRTLPPSLATWIGDQLEAIRRSEPVRKSTHEAARLRAEASSLYEEAAGGASRMGRHDLVLRAADRLRSLPELPAAERAYRLALQTMTGAGAPAAERVDGHVRLALCLWAAGRQQAALDVLGIAAGLDETGLGWRSRFVDQAMAADRDGPAGGDGHRRLRAWAARELRRHRSGVEAVRADCQDALLCLSADGRRYAQRGRDQTGVPRRPVVTPIRLAADPALLPQRAETPELTRLVESNGFEQVRHRFEERFGVVVPDVSIRAEERLTRGAYEFLVAEVPVLWRWADAAQQLADAMIGDLSLVYRRHVGAFLGVHEVAEMLDRLDARYSRLRQRALPDAGALSRFTRLLQLMVGDGASVADLVPILHAFARGRSADLAVIAERARACLPPGRLGLGGAPTFLRLSAGAERELAAFGMAGPDPNRLPCSPDLDALTRVLKELAAERAPRVLVAREAGNRTALAALAAAVDPWLAVVSAAEIARSGYADPIDYREVR